MKKIPHRLGRASVSGRPIYFSEFTENNINRIRIVLIAVIPLWLLDLWILNTIALEYFYPAASTFKDDQVILRVFSTLPTLTAIAAALFFLYRARDKITLRTAHQLSLITVLGVLIGEGLQYGLSHGNAVNLASFVLACFLCSALAPLVVHDQIIMIAIAIVSPMFSSYATGYSSHGSTFYLMASMVQPVGGIIIGLVLYYWQLGSFRLQRFTELRLERRTKEAERIRRELERQREAEKERIQWLENMASFLRHELRNALVGAKTSLALLQRKAAIADDDIYLKRSQKAFGIIGQLLDTASEATSIESTILKEHVEEIEINSIIRDEIESYRNIYVHQQFVLNMGNDNMTVPGREERIIQLLDKLVSNAVDHSEPGTPIIISCLKNVDWVEIRVRNQGPYLPSDKDAIFDLFTSFRARSADSGNRGYGLYVVKLIAERYGGYVTAENRNDVAGAEFRVILPLVR